MCKKLKEKKIAKIWAKKLGKKISKKEKKKFLS